MTRARFSRRLVVVALAVGVALCAGIPVFGLAAYNVVYFAREQRLRAEVPPTPTATPAPAITARPSPGPLCGAPPTMLVLMIGSDSRTDSYSAGLADAIRLVRVDFVHPGISYLAFPRDLYVEIPGIASHGGITHGKINQAYLYGNPAFGYSDIPGEGPGLLAETLRLNFGADVDRYIAINLQAFARLVDELGGLDINLPYTVDGRAARSTDRDRYFSAGNLHLSGYRTMLLARMRPNGDLERLHTQNLILQAFAIKLLAVENMARLPTLAQTLYGSVQTNLSAADISALLCLGSHMDASRIQAVDFPDAWFTGSRVQDPVLGNTFVWETDVLRMRDHVKRFEAGELTIAQGTESPTPEP